MLVELNKQQETNGQDDFQSSDLLELTNLTYQRKTLWTSNHQLNIKNKKKTSQTSDNETTFYIEPCANGIMDVDI